MTSYNIKLRDLSAIVKSEVLGPVYRWGAIHSTKVYGNFGPKLNGLVQSNQKNFEKLVHLRRWTTFPGRIGRNFGSVDHAYGESVQLAGLARFAGMFRLIPWFPFKFSFC